MFIFPSVMSVCPSGMSTTLDDDADDDATASSWCMLEAVSLSFAAAAAEEDDIALGSILCDEVLNCEEMVALLL